MTSPFETCSARALRRLAAILVAVAVGTSTLTGCGATVTAKLRVQRAKLAQLSPGMSPAEVATVMGGEPAEIWKTYACFPRLSSKDGRRPSLASVVWRCNQPPSTFTFGACIIDLPLKARRAAEQIACDTHCPWILRRIETCIVFSRLRWTDIRGGWEHLGPFSNCPFDIVESPPLSVVWEYKEYNGSGVPEPGAQVGEHEVHVYFSPPIVFVFRNDILQRFAYGFLESKSVWDFHGSSFAIDDQRLQTYDP